MTDRAAELPDLHSQIMNLPCKKIPGDVLNLYAYGHRDARHAAAELANHAAAIVAEMQGEISLLRAKLELREALDAWDNVMHEKNKGWPVPDEEAVYARMQAAKANLEALEVTNGK